MLSGFRIHPSVGVARVGDHPDDFFLAPEEIGGLPLECDITTGDNLAIPFTHFKNNGQIRRQGQKFRIYDGNGVEQDLEQLKRDGGIQSYKWTVHLANQKSSWYNYSELEGNLLLGADNSYAAKGVDPRNNITEKPITDDYRKKFLIDPGPVSITGSNADFIALDGTTTVAGYPVKFPHKGDIVGPPENGYEGFSQDGFGNDITKLGDIKTDTTGNLIVLGGYGDSWGHTSLSGYGGGDTWYDDIADGYVICDINVAAGVEPIRLKAWVIVGPPDFAPEIPNISSWDDTSFDAAVRSGHVSPELHNGDGLMTGFNTNFHPDYERDIKPIINRIAGYHWVANVQGMIGFSAELEGFSSIGVPGDLPLRAKYFSYFRPPQPATPDNPASTQPRQTQLFSSTDIDAEGRYEGIPMMPLNSGSNSVSNTNIEKFLALTPTQYFCLQQWSEGKLSVSGDSNWVDIFEKVDPLDKAGMGNVVGLPQCPGIEVTWTTQNPAIYDYSEGRLNQIKFEPVSVTDGIAVGLDECSTGTCQPGDLTKRMAIPWQADYYNCTLQLVNYTDPSINKQNPKDPASDKDLEPLPPNYYAYWWPPQAPWNVISEQIPDQDFSAPGSSYPQQVSYEQVGIAGLQVDYARGMNGYGQMINGGWAALGFIRNKNTDVDYGSTFAYFVETERNNDMFSYIEVPYAYITWGSTDDEEGSFVITSFNIPEAPQAIRKRCRKLLKALDGKTKDSLHSFSVKAKEIPVGHHRRSAKKTLAKLDDFTRIPVKRKVVGEMPRSGRRIRF